MVIKYHETKSPNAVIAAFRERFPERNPPTKRTIQTNVSKYAREGTSLNLNKNRSGRRRTVRTAENVERVRTMLDERPNEVSCRRNHVGMSKTTFNRVTRENLKWHPYKIHLVQQLQPGDYGRRINFSRWFLNQCHNPRFMPNIIIGDEAIFQMNGEVNTQNVRCYAPRGHPPEDNKYEKSNSREKFHVWIGLCGNGAIVGPHFFDRNVNGRTYLDMLNEIAFPSIAREYQRFGDVFERLWWFQDGAPAHGTREVRRRLSEVFENRVVALRHDVEWPPRSPDLTPCDFFLWGYLKQKVFATPPQDLQDLRRRIVDSTNELRERPQFIRQAFEEMNKRTNLCFQRNGGHVECL